MPKFLIERDWPEAGFLSQADLKNLAQQSCEVLDNMQIKIQWIKTYVTENKMYCVYIAPDEDTLLEYSSYEGCSVKRISLIKGIIDPVTAEDLEG